MEKSEGQESSGVRSPRRKRSEGERGRGASNPRVEQNREGLLAPFWLSPAPDSQIQPSCFPTFLSAFFTRCSRPPARPFGSAFGRAISLRSVPAFQILFRSSAFSWLPA